MGIAYCCGIEAFHYGYNVRFDLVGYASRSGAFLTRAALGSRALWLFRALYLDHLATIKHNSMFLRGRVREIHLLLLAHRLRFSDGILKEVRLMATVAQVG